MKYSDMAPDDQRVLLVSRLGDYEREDVLKLRDRLIARWRSVHPAADTELPSTGLSPLIRQEEWVKKETADPDEAWFNDVYYITVRRHERDAVFGTRGGMIQLGIASHDGTARHDWRDFQAIKNQLCGPECEGFELYPAESRLLDPSNYYTIWCFPGLRRLKVGLEVCDVRGADEALAPQRGFQK